MKNRYTIDWEQYALLGRKSAAEGCVLLKNENHALPIEEGNRISIFGRIQFDYIKSGTGSGGLVNTKYVTGILHALKEESSVQINENLLHVYEQRVKDHPYDKGTGWAKEPWCQEEMPLTDDLVLQAAEESDIAVVILGRLAGEDKDNKNEEGSYLLTELEEDMLKKVCKRFDRVAVVLNVGNILDMKWVDAYKPDAVLYVWQGGMEGGNGAADILLGKTNPSGKLADTIAYDYEDYPSANHFGHEKEDYYAEDIYVGYRYFETFAKEKVQYPFGFGLSYTTFSIDCERFERLSGGIKAVVKVTNTGKVSGKEVVQVYVNPPQGKLGKPLRNLIAFEKTKILSPGESQIIEIEEKDSTYASYDDSGVTGNKSCYVLEAGEYAFYIGNQVRQAKLAGTFQLNETILIETCTQAAAPVAPFKRLKPGKNQAKDTIEKEWEEVPLRTYVMAERIKNSPLLEIAYTGNQGYQLGDVYDHKISLETFIAQLSQEELCCMVRGEGMCSPKVTPGTASAFGGVTESLKEYGIPVGCCADGPSGIRMDCGTYAFAMPNGTCLACTFHKELVKELYTLAGLELRKNRIDTLLGPGINIHRNPLNGRNFEYFSEDPYLTGKMAAAQLKGMREYGVTGTIKHFTANNQEYQRREINSIISERALREIYLKAFEWAVKEGKAYSIMSTYGAVNGLWTASNYDLLTTILRGEWKFDGMVMTDWFAFMNEEGVERSVKNMAAMVRCQNDVYMVVDDALKNTNHDNLEECLKDGSLDVNCLRVCAMNICRMLLKSPVMERFLGRLSKEEEESYEAMNKEDVVDFDLTYYTVDEELIIDTKDLDTQKGSSKIYGLSFQKSGKYTVKLKVRSNLGELAQIPVSLFYNQELIATITINGTNGKWLEIEKEFEPVVHSNNYMKLYFAQGGMEIDQLTIRFKE
jgi:beta-glucosidase